MPTTKPTPQHPLRDSWLPRQHQHQPYLQPNTTPDDAEIEELDLAHMDENPLIYFLTPTPPSYASAGGDDGMDMDMDMDFDMDFDAGIEDAKHPAPIIRSVSPSSLVGGLSLPPGSGAGSPRPPTPPRSPATPELEFDLSATPEDWEGEQYDYLHSHSAWRQDGSSSSRRRLWGGEKKKFRGAVKQDHQDLGQGPFFAAPGAEMLAPPPRSSSLGLGGGGGGGAGPRGRAASRAGLASVNIAGASSSSSGRPRGTRRPARLSPHAWREPSPDVWAIEEETAEELGVGGDYGNEVNNNSWMAGDDGGFGHGEELGSVVVTRAVDIPAAKPKNKKKKVRFALPALEDDGRGVH